MFNIDFMAAQLFCRIKIFITGAALLIGMPDSVYSQERKSEFDGLSIPPLGRLIAAAQEHSPLLDQQSALITMRRWQTKSSNIEWGRYLLFFTEYRYGSIELLVPEAGFWVVGEQANSSRYNVGTRLQLSIFDGLDLKNKRGVANAQLEFETKKFEDLKRMIKDDVIRLWNKLISYQEILAINEDHIAAQDVNFFYAEQQYKAGDIALLEYARIKEISIKADLEYQLAKKEFRETYLLLESLVGVEFSKLNEPAK